MKSLILLAMTALFVTGCGRVAESPMAEPAPTSTAPDTSIPVDLELVPLTPGDGPISISDFAGRIVLLDFWATWNAPCREAALELSDLYAELKDEGLTVVGMTVDRGDVEAVAAKAQALALSYAAVRAEEVVQERFGGIRALPTKILLDRHGDVIARYEGAVSIDSLRADILKALAQ